MLEDLFDAAAYDRAGGEVCEVKQMLTFVVLPRGVDQRIRRKHTGINETSAQQDADDNTRDQKGKSLPERTPGRCAGRPPEAEYCGNLADKTRHRCTLAGRPTRPGNIGASAATARRTRNGSAESKERVRMRGP